jgi:EAL domain-containing protein (putative c-di-GMP-specific phosphodiesterase class I)
MHLECINNERNYYTIRKRYITSKNKIVYVRLNVRYVCNKHECFSIATAADISVEHEIETIANFRQRLLNAVAHEDFILHYQPIATLKDFPLLNLKKYEIFAHEALVRWKDKEVLVYPDTFLPTLRLLGMESELCKLVLDIGIKKIANTNRRICINIEPLTLALPEFDTFLFSVLERYNITNPSLIVLEIVESEGMEDALEEKLKLLAKHFLISLDDWGSRYNNLARIGTLPVHLVKLDKSILKNRIVTERAIGLIHELGMMAIAEGVETEEQKLWLESIHCDFDQGWHFGKPQAELTMQK